VCGVVGREPEPGPSASLGYRERRYRTVFDPSLGKLIVTDIVQ